MVISKRIFKLFIKIISKIQLLKLHMDLVSTLLIQRGKYFMIQVYFPYCTLKHQFSNKQM